MRMQTFDMRALSACVAFAACAAPLSTSIPVDKPSAFRYNTSP